MAPIERSSDYECPVQGCWCKRERPTNIDPLDPCLSCDGRDGNHTPECYFAPHEEANNG